MGWACVAGGFRPSSGVRRPASLESRPSALVGPMPGHLVFHAGVEDQST